MNQDQWTRVDEYLAARLAPDDAALSHALKASRDSGLPEIQVAPNQGKLLHMLARMAIASNTTGDAAAARAGGRILEIGSLGGYSAIWLARALGPGGRLISLELREEYAAVARANLAHAGLADVAEVRSGRALDSLERLAADDEGPFDFVFIDADKASTPAYFAWAMKLTRRGGLIVVDNVVREGAIIDESGDDPSVQGMRRFFEDVAREKRAIATAVQVVGVKGYDGLAVVMVTS